MAKLYRTPQIQAVQTPVEYDLMRLSKDEHRLLVRGLGQLVPSRVRDTLLAQLTQYDDGRARRTRGDSESDGPRVQTIPGAITELDEIVARHQNELHVLRRDRSRLEQAVLEQTKRTDMLVREITQLRGEITNITFTCHRCAYRRCDCECR